MLIKRPNDVLPSEITNESVYIKRRELLKRAGLATAGILAGHSVFAADSTSGINGLVLKGVQKSPFSTDQPANSWADITTYNNYY